MQQQIPNQMYSGSPYMVTPTVTIPQVQTVMEAAAACGPELENNGYDCIRNLCSIQVFSAISLSVICSVAGMGGGRQMSMKILS